jgi:alkylation response protein AidB-like acyl-CoA dehydrogenase
LATRPGAGPPPPDSALLGEEGAGWRQLGAALLNERSGMAWLGWARRDLEAILELAAGTGDATVRTAVAGLVTDYWLGCRFAQRVIEAQDAGGAPVVESSIAKVWATELLTRIAAVGARLLGPAALTAPGWFADADPGAWCAYEVVERRHPPLSVGANEVQRSTIAQVGLGLPRDP